MRQSPLPQPCSTWCCSLYRRTASVNYVFNPPPCVILLLLKLGLRVGNRHKIHFRKNTPAPSDAAHVLNSLRRCYAYL